MVDNYLVDPTALQQRNNSNIGHLQMNSDEQSILEHALIQGIHVQHRI